MVAKGNDCLKSSEKRFPGKLQICSKK